jgi:hypothetical protein
VECNETQRRICLISGTATPRQITSGEKVLRSAQNDRVDLATKKLTDLNGNRRPDKLSGNNKQGPCNKTGATAESQEIYLDNNCISNGLGEMSSPDGRNDDCYLASRKPASAVWREENHLNAVAAVKIFSRPIKPGDRNDESKPQGDSKLF